MDVYGLGQQFVSPGTSDIEWEGMVREGGAFGNVMAGFNGGANGNTQIPVMYAVNGASFDEEHFPDPAGKISALRENEGIGLMLIEEAYIGKALPEHTDLHSRGCLAKEHPGGTNPAYLTGNCWWGKGGILDYTNDACSEYWHNTKRKPLIEMGIIGHWTDLGEPEMYNSGSGYSVGDHADAHNIFNFRWIRGINKGYAVNNESQRPFMMSRSGAAGIQRFGAAMWSGDIASRLSSLAAHAANQMHMSFSGIDYYGAEEDSIATWKKTWTKCTLSGTVME